MYKFNLKNKKGAYSIVEILIYLAIFTTMSIVVINSFIIILASFSNIRSNNDLMDSGVVAMERISREIRQAKNIDTVNTTSTTLVLINTDSSTTKFIQSGNLLNVYKNNNLIGSIIPSDIYITSIVFTRISNTNTEGVNIVMTLQDHRDSRHKSAVFRDTLILRGGY